MSRVWERLDDLEQDIRISNSKRIDALEAEVARMRQKPRRKRSRSKLAKGQHRWSRR